MTAPTVHVEGSDGIGWEIAGHMRPPNPKRYSVSWRRNGDKDVHLGFRDLQEVIDMVYAVMDLTTPDGDGHAADDAYAALLNQLYHMRASTYDGTFVVAGSCAGPS